MDFGSFKPPEWEQHARLSVLNEKLRLIRVGLGEDMARDPREWTEETYRRIERLANEATAISNELRSLGLTVTPYVPLLNADHVTLNLSSDPSELPGLVQVYEFDIRPSPLLPLNTLGGWEGSPSGETSHIVRYRFNGNYGVAQFFGTVDCCDIEVRSNDVVVIVTGMCREEARRVLEDRITAILRSRQQTVNLFSTIGPMCLVLAQITARMAAAEPLLVPIVIIALLLAATAGIMLDQWNAGTNKILGGMRRESEPYIESLPPCY